MSSFLASSASSEEKSDSRFVRSGRTKAPVLFPCLHDPVPLSLSSLSMGRAGEVGTASLALFPSLSRRAVESRRARPGHSQYAPRVPTYTRCKYTRMYYMPLYKVSRNMRLKDATAIERKKLSNNIAPVTFQSRSAVVSPTTEVLA